VPGGPQVARVDDVEPVRPQRLDDVLRRAERLVDADRLRVADDDGVQEVRGEVVHVLRRLRPVVLVLVLQAEARLVRERKAEARHLDPRA